MAGIHKIGRLPTEDRRTRRAMVTFSSSLFEMLGDGLIVAGGVISVDLALDPGLEFMAPDWGTGTVYAVNDKVTETAVTYVCLVAHTADTFATDLAVGKWRITATDPLRVKIKAASGMIRDADGLSVDHDAADNFVANEHIDWTAATESLVAGRVTVNQTADANGLNLFGYDDKSADFVKLSVNSSGTARLESSGVLAMYLNGQAPSIQLSHDGSNATVYTSTGAFQFNSHIRMPDSFRVYFGSSLDSFIEHDGNSLNIICNAVVGTDDFVVQSENFTLNSSGDLSLTGQLGIGVAKSDTRAINAALSSGPSSGTGLYAIRMKVTRTSPSDSIYGIATFFTEPVAGPGAGETLVNVVHFAPKTVEIASGSVTNQYGLFFYSNYTTATNNYVLKNEAAGAMIHTIGDIYIHADSKKLFFGAADDASIYYSGSNLVLNPKDVGTGYVDVLGKILATNGTRVAQIADATYAGYFTDGTRTAWFCNGFDGLYTVSGSNYCQMLDGTHGLRIYSTTLIGLDVAATTPASRVASFSATSPNGYVHFVTNTGYGIYSTLPIKAINYIESTTYVRSAKARMTAEGGFAVLLTNKTGANSVAGKVVQSSATNDDAVMLTTNDDDDCFGVMYEDGVADGSETWIVVSGIADVMLEDNVGITRGDWIGAGDAGYAQVVAGSPPAAPTHFLEMGHCIESVAAGGGGTHVKARCVLHFN